MKSAVDIARSQHDDRGVLAPRILPAAERLARYLLNRAGVASRTVHGCGIPLHVYDAPGRGTLPTVILIHGLGANGSQFAPLVAMLRKQVRRVVVPELPGHGFSAHPGKTVTPELLASCLTGVLGDAVPEPAIVVGNSLGGALAIQYALREPARTKGLFLVSPAGARIEEHDWASVRAAFAMDSRASALAFMERIYHRKPWFLALVAHEFPELMRRPAIREILETATNEHAPTPEDLAKLTMPVVLLWGKSERLLPDAALAYFRAHLPKTAVIERPEGFGHTPQLDATPKVAERILRFAREIHSRS